MTPKIKKVKKIESKVKIIEKEPSGFDLEEEVDRSELEGLSEFINGASQQEIAPVLRQGEVPSQQVVQTAVKEEEEREEGSVEAAPDVRSYEGRSATYGPRTGGQSSSRTYDPSIRSSRTQGMVTQEAAQSRLVNTGIPGQTAPGQGEGLGPKAIETDRKDQYEEKKSRRGAHEGG